MASIVPTPNGLNDSPTGRQNRFCHTNGPTVPIPVTRDYPAARVTTHQV
ncbi:Unknown protein sequence [Pseudomonas coronafaciens pv. oryzae]|nr:Unknown protein sequence [Pseudomonas coronafaciens pv. oryzae]